MTSLRDKQDPSTTGPGFDGDRTMEAARKGDMSAMLAWAESLLDTNSKEKLPRAREYLAKAKAGEPFAWWLTGAGIFDGSRPYSRNEELGMLLVNKSADMGSPDAYSWLARIALGRGQYEEAVKQFKAAVAVDKDRVNDASYSLAICKLLGIGMPKYPAEALADLRKLAELSSDVQWLYDMPGSAKCLAKDTLEMQVIDGLFARYLMKSKGIDKSVGEHTPLAEIEKLLGQGGGAQDALAANLGNIRATSQSSTSRFKTERDAVIAEAKRGDIPALMEWSRNAPQYVTAGVRIENLFKELNGNRSASAARNLADLFSGDEQTFDLALGWVGVCEALKGSPFVAEIKVYRARKNMPALMEAYRKAVADGGWLAITYALGLILGLSGKKDVALAYQVLQGARGGRYPAEADLALSEGRMSKGELPAFFTPRELSGLTERNGTFDIEEAELRFTGEKSFRAYVAAHAPKPANTAELAEKSRNGDLAALIARARLLKAQVANDARDFEKNIAALDIPPAPSGPGQPIAGIDKASDGLLALARIFDQVPNNAEAEEVAALFYLRNCRHCMTLPRWERGRSAVAMADFFMRKGKHKDAVDILNACAGWKPELDQKAWLDGYLSVSVGYAEFDCQYGLCLLLGVGGRKDVAAGLKILQRQAVADANSGNVAKERAVRISRLLETGAIPREDAILLLGIDKYGALKRDDYTVFVPDAENFFTKERTTEALFKSREKARDAGAPAKAEEKNKMPQPVVKPANEKDPFQELQELIGMERVKKSVASVANQMTLFKLRKQAGLPYSGLTLHFVFSGNPGTGKTTVARILGRILRDVGYLAKGHTVEVSAKDLIGEYVGSTAPKTAAKVQEALGGILFIDEAYALLGQTGSKSDFSQDAISTLLKLMEDRREEFVIVAAGYPAEMRSFVDSNPGLKSRFTEFLNFDDYNGAELAQIYLKMAGDNAYKLDARASAALQEIMAEAPSLYPSNFPNARFVRNLFEDSVKSLADRVAVLARANAAQVDVQQLTTLLREDLTAAYDEAKASEKEDTKTFGFRA